MKRLACLFLLSFVPACLSSSQKPTQSAPAGPPKGEDRGEIAEESEPLVQDEIETEPEPGETEPPPQVEQPPHPFADTSDEELEKMLLEDPASLGPVSIGKTNAGALFNGEQMPNGDRWDVVNPRETWGTHETIEFLVRCIDKVNDQFPNTEKLHIGDMSVHDGGHLSPHISHQSGRDVDISYYYTTPQHWYMKADASNLDLARTWALVRAMVTETDVELILIDRSIQKLLKDYALGIGEDPAWLDQIFGGESTTMRPLVRHAEGHKTHIHVRFYNPVAQETGRRLYRAFLAHKLIKPPTYYIKYKVRRGDTLGKMAKKFNTSIKALKRANGLRSTRIFANRTYKIPRRGGVSAPRKLVLPQRRLPPFDPKPQSRVSEAAPGSSAPAEKPAPEKTE